ncbi:MAG TPA: DeoR/GlpR family DNA-binding transcription regulator, partial [Paracoccaceae bacterium]|nr:DeoR/GlpR family DNA-binding transcription regulator [Paracoccaceae bacterium]
TRQETILALVRQQGRVLVEDLSRSLGTTPQTIRKDLRQLEEAGHVTRFHGGARLRAGQAYLAYELRRAMAGREKRAIGEAAARMLPQGATVFINAGTTTEEAARALPEGMGLRVICDNVEIANITRRISGVTTIVAGGEVRPADGAVVGAAAVAFLEQFRADFALIGAAAVSADGTLMDYDLDEVMVARVMMRNAGQVLLLVDSGKFDASAPVRIGHVGETAMVITDTCPSAGLRDVCAREGVTLCEISPADAEPVERANA